MRVVGGVYGGSPWLWNWPDGGRRVRSDLRGGSGYDSSSQAEMEVPMEGACHRTFGESEERGLPTQLRSPTAWQVALAKGELGSPAIDPVRSTSKGLADADPRRHLAGEMISVMLWRYCDSFSWNQGQLP